MKIKFKFNDGVISLPKEIYSHLKNANEVDAKVIFAIASENEFDVNKITQDLNISEDEFNQAIGFWRASGIIEVNTKTKETKRQKKLDNAINVQSIEYTSEDVEKLMESNPELDIIINKCEEVLGKTFSSGDSKVIIYMFDHLNLPSEYIVLLCQHFKSRGHTGLRYIEKAATNLYDEGIKTTEQLLVYIGKKNKEYDMVNTLRSLFGIGERALTPKEESIISSWAKMDLKEDDLIRAYNTMMDAIDKPNFKYMDKIIQTSFAQDTGEIKEQSDVKQKRKYTKRNVEKKDSSFNIDNFFENNLKNSFDD